MKDLNIFISYSHEDETIATALSNLLHQAFGPALAEAFLDKRSISFGTGIKECIAGALDRADLLVAIVTDAGPTSVLSWPGWEIGRFSAYWDPNHQKDGHHKNREKGNVIGQVVLLSNGARELGPEVGNRPVDLGISEALLAGPENANTVAAFRKAAMANNELLRFMQDIEDLVRNEPDYDQFFRQRDATLPELVADFKVRAFLELKRRVRSILKPSKQLIVRYRAAVPGNCGLELPEDAKIASVGGASEVFGKRESDLTLFEKVAGAPPGSARYETTWGAFKTSVKDYPYGAYWCGVIEQAVLGATTGGTEVDPNLVLISSGDQRYRIIATTVTTYFNNDVEVSLYLIEGLQRRDYGDADTSNLLNLLTSLCRFRFAFLEPASPYYWQNFAVSLTSPPARAKDLLMELDYLRSERIHAGHNMPGVWSSLVDSDQLTQTMKVYMAADLEVRTACNQIIGQKVVGADAHGLVAQITTQLKKIFDEVGPFNTLCCIALAKRLQIEFGQNGGNQGASPGKAGD